MERARLSVVAPDNRQGGFENDCTWWQAWGVAPDFTQDYNDHDQKTFNTQGISGCPGS
jgi:hypothetical protein